MKSWMQRILQQSYLKTTVKIEFTVTGEITLHTVQNSQNKWTKISDLETNIFELKLGVKSGLEFFYFEILLAPSELLLPSAERSAQKG